MEYNFERIKIVLPDIALDDFSFNQKIQIMKAIEENVDINYIRYLANESYSAEKMKILIQILRMNTSEELKRHILLSDMDESQLSEIKKCIKNGVSKKMIIFLVNAGLDEDVIYAHRRHHESKGRIYGEVESEEEIRR